VFSIIGYWGSREDFYYRKNLMTDRLCGFVT